MFAISFTDKSISERNYFAPAKKVGLEESHTSVSREDSPVKYHHDSSSLIVYFSLLIIIVFGLLVHVLLKWRLGKKLRKTSLPVSSPPNTNKNGHLYLQYHQQHMKKLNNFELRPFITTTDCLKCSHEKNCNVMIRA